MKNVDTILMLVVEDNEDDQEMIRWALQKENLTGRLFVLNNGAEALDYLFRKGQYAGRDVNQIPRVILLDLKLPKIDGIEVLRRLKADEQTKSIPVVIMTSSSEPKDVQRTYSLGVNSYVVKPVDSEKFDSTVRELGKYWLSINHPPN